MKTRLAVVYVTAERCEDDHFLYTDHLLGLYFVCKNVSMSLSASNVRKEKNSLGNLQLSDVLGFSVNFK